MSDTVPMFICKENRYEDDGTYVVACYGFSRMCSGGDSNADGNANPTHGNTYSTDRNPDEHAWANSCADT